MKPVLIYLLVLLSIAFVPHLIDGVVTKRGIEHAVFVCKDHKGISYLKPNHVGTDQIVCSDGYVDRSSLAPDAKSIYW